MTNKLIKITVLLFLTHFVWSQSKQIKLSEKQDSIYEANINREYLQGVYIPKDLEDCFNELIRLSPRESLDRMAAAPEELAAKKLHLGLGKWIAHNWSFYEGSRFSAYLKTLGISYPDDMIEFTIISFHRHLNDVDLQIKELAKVYIDKREAELSKRLESAETISKRIRKN